jgi:dynein intermediate chain 2
MYNGQVLFWDLRADKPQGQTPADIERIKYTDAEKSHYDSVFDVVWPNSKTGTECISVAPDGKVLWWDTRNLQQGPVTTAILTDGSAGDRVIGATRIDNSTEVSQKCLVGTEQGYVMQIMKKQGTKGEVSTRFGMEGGKHHGPIFAIQRNPAAGAGKFFLTVGDWTAKIWADDLKVPLITTRYHDAYLTDGCWSNSRPGIFFLTRMDGWIDIWDYYYRQNEVCYSQKISDYPLTCLAVKSKSPDILIGDASGSVTLLQLCKSLWEPMPKGLEEGVLKTMFEREYSREKSLVMAKKAADKKEAKPKEAKQTLEKKKTIVENKLQTLEKEFFNLVKKHQDQLEGGEASPEKAEHKSPDKKEEKKDEDEYNFEGDDNGPGAEKKEEKKTEAKKEPEEKKVEEKKAEEKKPDEKKPDEKKVEEKKPEEKKPEEKAPEEKKHEEKKVEEIKKEEPKKEEKKEPASPEVKHNSPEPAAKAEVKKN